MHERKDIKGYEGSYQVDTSGEVFSLARECWRGELNRNRVSSEFKLKNRLDNLGYVRVTLRKNGITKTKRLHRVLAEAFIPNPLNLPQVNHKNGIKSDFRLENLEWVTCRQNVVHAFETGLTKHGETHHASKLSDKTVRDIRKEYVRNKVGYKRLAKKYGISPSYIHDLVNFTRRLHDHP